MHNTQLLNEKWKLAFPSTQDKTVTFHQDHNPACFSRSPKSPCHMVSACQEWSPQKLKQSLVDGLTDLHNVTECSLNRVKDTLSVDFCPRTWPHSDSYCLFLQRAAQGQRAATPLKDTVGLFCVEADVPTGHIEYFVITECPWYCAVSKLVAADTIQYLHCFHPPEISGSVHPEADFTANAKTTD